MVHLDLGEPNTDLLTVARGLADRLGASVTGIAASQPLQAVFGGSYAIGDVVQQDREEVETEMDVAEAAFRAAFQTHNQPVGWRSTITFEVLDDYIAQEARCADLVMTGAGPGYGLGQTRSVNIGELVMQVGRPVFIVPRFVKALKLDRAVIAWKDTREARRAAYNALPLLKMAGHVAVVEIAGEDDLANAGLRVQDVVGWLERHGIAAQAITSGDTGDDADRLKFVVRQQDADFIVAGAYGHSRLREWVLGGVTKDLLLCAERCSLVSH
jgi:nucleotide-binding universal stress UspA family protein